MRRSAQGGRCASGKKGSGLRQQAAGKAIDMNPNPPRHHFSGHPNDAITVTQANRITIDAAHGFRKGGVKRAPAIGRPVPLDKMINHHSIGNFRNAFEKSSRPVDRKERRYGDYDLQAPSAQLCGGREPFCYRTRRRRQAGQPVAIALDRDMNPELASVDKQTIKIHVGGFTVPVGLQDQEFGRNFQYDFQNLSRDSESIFLRKKRIGRARHEDPESSTARARPDPLGLKAFAIRVRGVRPSLQEAAPPMATSEKTVVLDIAADTAERVAEGATTIRLQRMRG